MAEFSEVMHNIQRRCNLCGQGERWGCTIRGLICERISGMPHDADWRAIETEVMAWAAEHPEPVYPTWGDWLAEIGLINWQNNGEGVYSVMVPTFKMCNPIPADIAQKLGIEPKE